MKSLLDKGFGMLTIFLPDSEATHSLGYLFGQNLSPNSVILLSGNLGAGKTTLVQGIGRGLGISELIVSPTFTLINEYSEGRLPLYHLDLYRLEPAQADSLYPEIYWEGIEVDPGITAIEWWQRLIVKPKKYLEVMLSAEVGETRTARIGQSGMNDSDLSFLESFQSIERK